MSQCDDDTNSSVAADTPSLLANLIAAPVIRRIKYLPAEVPLTSEEKKEAESGQWTRRVVIVARPFGSHNDIVFRNELLHVIKTPIDFIKAKVIYLTNDHEPDEIEGETIFDDNIPVHCRNSTANRLRFVYQRGGEYLFRDLYSLRVWSGNTEKIAISHAEIC